MNCVDGQHMYLSCIPVIPHDRNTGQIHMLTIDAAHLPEINMPLAFPFETSFGITTMRRILLVEIESDGLTAWGECVAGEHPYFSEESVDTAWIVTEQELAPRLVGQELVGGGSCPGVVLRG